jgi:hypothetical protein
MIKRHFRECFLCKKQTFLVFLLKLCRQMRFLIFLLCYCDILNRFHCLSVSRTKCCFVRQIIVCQKSCRKMQCMNKTVILVSAVKPWDRGWWYPEYTLSIITSFGLGASLSWIVSQSPCVIYWWERGSRTKKYVWRNYRKVVLSRSQ